ncbi:hypothetical protein R84981_000350 [Carnimonas sp. R-84981]|uniref:APC family permease n=1 Tax=Carnimonas bestiolae TaxID=3402172 RepID=UPI003EDB817A
MSLCGNVAELGRQGWLDPTLLGIGSRWLFAGAKSAALAGSDAGWAWLLGTLIILLIALGISFVVYLLLQYAYLGAVPNSVLSEKGWDGVASLYSSPYADIAIHLGLGWLTSLVLVDAVISPAGTGNIYIAGASRVLFAWAKNGHLFELFSRVDPKSGVPRGALWLSLIISIAWTLPSNFQVWGGLISACTSAMVFTYMPGSTSLAAFRARMPQMQRPFSLPFHHFLSPLTMIACTFLLYWSGWNVVSVLVPILVAAWVLYALFGTKMKKALTTFTQRGGCCSTTSR